MKRIRPVIAVLIAALLAAGIATIGSPPVAAAGPALTVTPLVEGLSIPWDLGFTPDGTMVFTERPGRLKVRLTDGTVRQLSADMSDLFASGETGLMGLVIDPGYSVNRRIYTCQGDTAGGVQVIGWTIDAGYTAATRVIDPLVAGLSRASGGRHGGCRLRFGADGYLYIGTGDGATGTNPQNLESLGGKVLRVDSQTGAGAPGNPFSGSANRQRIYTYGHRNVQGLALRPGTNQLWTTEHGPTRDDEVNLLQLGGNYGWDPVPGYDESVPMTDLTKFPDAIPARWSSGAPTVAASGAIFIEGAQWGEWNGALAVAALKGSELLVMRFDQAGALVSVDKPPELDGTFGRLRTPMMGPDGALYVTTANGSNDKILRVVPANPPAPTPAPTTAPGTPAPPPSPGIARPVGALDRVDAVPGSISVHGWTADPDSAAPIAVHVYVDGVLTAAEAAGDARPDVAAAFPTLGPAHGFSIGFDATLGLHQVCVYGINDGPGGNALIGCRDVAVPRRAGARSVATGYSGADAASLQRAAVALDLAPDTFQKTGVYVAAFLTRLGARPGPRPLTPPPSTTGPTTIATAWSADEVEILDYVAAYYALDDAAAQKLGATLLVFLEGLR